MSAIVLDEVCRSASKELICHLFGYGKHLGCLVFDQFAKALIPYASCVYHQSRQFRDDSAPGTGLAAWPDRR